MKLAFVKNKHGVTLIMAILLMTLILFLASYILNSSLTENKIARSQSWGAKTYYLAEAGIQEMVWKLKNDATYKQNFETNPAWTVSFTRNNPFGAGNGSYTVSITNSSLAHGTIISTGTIDMGNGITSQRIVRTVIYKALGESPLPDIAGYGDHDISITNSLINYYDGGIHSNHNIDINGISVINIEGDLNTVHDYSKDPLCDVNVSGEIHSRTNPPAPDSINMPAIDFDSSESTSLKNQADVIYTTNQFSNLLKNNQNLTLNNKITYVDGDVDIYGAQNLTINGLLVIKHDLTVGDELCRGILRCGTSNITVNNVSGYPSGIVVGHKINFEYWSGAINITGLLYSSQDLTVNSLPLGQAFNITGDLISGHNLQIGSIWRTINITKNDEVFSGVFGSPSVSPIVSVEHWEEEY